MLPALVSGLRFFRLVGRPFGSAATSRLKPVRSRPVSVIRFYRMEVPMLVEMRRVADIKLYPNNPRCNDHAVAAVAASIKEFGFRQPLVLDDEGVIIVGSTRFKAALRLGLQTVPVHVAKGLTPAQVK